MLLVGKQMQVKNSTSCKCGVSQAPRCRPVRDFPLQIMGILLSVLSWRSELSFGLSDCVSAEEVVETAVLGVYWSVCLQRSVCFEAVLQVFEDITHEQTVMC